MADQKKTKALKRFHSSHLSDQVNEFLADIVDDLGINPKSIKDYGDKPIDKIEVIPTGVPEIDDLLGIGGFPRKTYVHLYGMPKSGKSWLAQKTMAALSRVGGRTLYLDIENGFNPFRAKQLGVDLDMSLIAGEFESGEVALQLMCRAMYDPDYEEKTGLHSPKMFDLIVFDSMAASGSQNQLEANIGGQLTKDKKMPNIMPGTKALMFSNFLPRMTRAISKSEGIWEEEMKVALLGQGNTLDLSPAELGTEKMKAIQAVIEARKDIDHEFLRDAIERANLLNSTLQQMVEAELISLEQVETYSAAIFKGKTEQHEKLISKLSEAGGEVLSRLDPMIAELERGFPILNAPDAELDEFETKVLRGRVVDSTRHGLYVIHYNPGTAVLMINQLRAGNIGGGYVTKETPGGAAMKYLAGTFLEVNHVSRSAGGEIKDGDEVIGGKSRFTLDQSRYAKPHSAVEVTIPFTDLAPDPLTELISLAQTKDLYSYSRSTHKIPKDGSVIKTKDDEEFYISMLDNGLDYLAGELKWNPSRMDHVREFLFEKLSSLAEGELVEEETEDEEEE